MRRGGNSGESALRHGTDGRKIEGLGVGWSDVTVSEIYTVHDIRPFLEEELLKRMDYAGAHGVTWHYSQPPIESIEYEMDLRGCVTELVI